MMSLFRISAMLRPKAVRNVVPSFGRQALAKRRLAKANLLLVRMKRSTISAVDISIRLLLLVFPDFAPPERLRVSGAHSPRARRAGRRSSRLYAKRLISSRTLACRHRHLAVPSVDLGNRPSFESPTTINNSNLVLLVIMVFCSFLLRLRFGLPWFGGSRLFTCSHLARASLSCQWHLCVPEFLVPTPFVVVSRS